MTLNELKAIVDAAVEHGRGDYVVVYGDCNGKYRAGYAGTGYVEDLEEYCMEPGTTDTGEPVFEISE